MFNKTNINGDDLPGAVAKLLCERPGEWFTYTSYGSSESYPTALIVRLTEKCFYDVYGHSHTIDKATHDRLLTVLNKHAAAFTPPDTYK